LDIDKKKIIEILIASFYILIGFWNLKLMIPFAIIGLMYSLWKSPKEKISIGYASISLLLFIAFGFVSIRLSDTINFNTSYFSNFLISSLIVLQLVLLSKREVHISIIYVYVCSSILWLCIGFVFWGIQLEGVIKLFPFDLTNFKNLYTPFGMVANEWYSYLLLCLPINLILIFKDVKSSVLNSLIKLHAILLVIGLIISFSRGVYLSIFLFVIIISCTLLSRNSIVKKRALLKKISFLIIPVILCLVLFNKSIYTTLSFNKTVSQNRSTKGRIEKWKSIDALILEQPLFGAGPGSYNLEVNKIKIANDSNRFSARLDNGYLLLLVENGIVGLTIFLVFIILLVSILVRALVDHKNKPREYIRISILLSGLLAFLFRELTFSSLNTDNIIISSFTILIIFILRYEKRKVVLRKNNASQIVLSLGVILLGFSILKINFYKSDLVRNNKKWLKNYNARDYQLSENHMQKVVKNNASNFKILKHHSLDLLGQDFLLGKHFTANNIAKYIHAKDSSVITKVIKILERSKRSFPYDAEVYHNLSWLYLVDNKEGKSKINLEECLRLESNNYVYLASKFLFTSNKIERVGVLTNILKTHPVFINSILFKKIETDYPSLVIKSIENAINILDQEIKRSNSPILKSKLAILLLEINPIKSKKLLVEVTNALPNMNRPWLFLAYLNLKENDLINSRLNLERASQLDSNDYLTFYYWAHYYQLKGDTKKYNDNLRISSSQFLQIPSPSYRKNSLVLDYLPSPKLTTIPFNLHYYCQDGKILKTDQINNVSSYFEVTKDSFLLEKHHKTIDKLKKMNLYDVCEKTSSEANNLIFSK